MMKSARISGENTEKMIEWCYLTFGSPVMDISSNWWYEIDYTYETVYFNNDEDHALFMLTWM